MTPQPPFVCSPDTSPARRRTSAYIGRSTTAPRPVPTPLMTTLPRLLLVAAALVFAPVAGAQDSWRTHADLARARVALDSFTVFAGDRPIGWQRLGWAKEGETRIVGLVLWDWKPLSKTVGSSSWIMSDEIALNGVSQRSEVRFSTKLVELGLRQQGRMGTTDMRIALDRAQDRMTGTALTPSGGATPAVIDVPASDDIIDDNALSVILPLVRWREGLTFTIPVLASGKGTTETYTASVVERRTTTVPAGTFEVWRVALAGGRYVLEADVTTAAPYRVVRFGPRGAPMSSQLAR
ncbi:hypothetical protein MASR1M101_19790 [Gemmatimonas sp.]